MQININVFSMATAFVFYDDAKHADFLQGSIHVRCYFF